MSIHALAQAVTAVFPDRVIVTPQGSHLPLRRVMLAIAGVETGWSAQYLAGDAVGGCSTCFHPACRGYTSYGYWQVHFPAWASYLKQATGSRSACDWADWLSNPTHSAEAAWHLYQTAEKEFGNGLQPWWPDVTGTWRYPHVTSTHPAYLEHLSAARQALAQVAAATASHKQHPTAPGPTPAPTPTQGTTPSRSFWVIALGSGLVGAGVLVGLEFDWHWPQVREAVDRLG